MLDRTADDVWTLQRPLRFLVEMGTRMTIVRLVGGGLFVHSPVALDEATKAAVDALGTVEAIVAPNLFHHLFVPDWTRAYPKASVSACPGLEKKRADVKWSRTLGDAPAAEWSGELEQVFFGAFAMANEIVFFHRKTNTIIASDFILNLAAHPSLFTRVVVGLAGHREPGITLLERLMIRDRGRAREEVDRILGWGAERIVLAHGDVIATNASEVIERAYRWL